MKGKSIFKALLGAYSLTTLLLLLLAFFLFRYDLQENIVNAGITIVYILSCFLGGFIVGKGMIRQKYIWGALIGIVYFALLTGVSFALDSGSGIETSRMIMTMALCVGAGMLGGMLS